MVEKDDIDLGRSLLNCIFEELGDPNAEHAVEINLGNVRQNDFAPRFRPLGYLLLLQF